MKKLVVVVLVLVFIVGIFAYLLVGNLDTIVKSAIERVGTDLTGTGVHLKEVNIDLAAGSATLKGLTIDNPPGYQSDYVFYLQEVTVGLDLASLSGPVTVLNEVRVQGSRLYAEQRGESTNLADLLSRVEANAKQSDSADQEQTPGEATEARLAIGQFVFANTEATVISEVKGSKSIKVPDIRRRNIGDPQQGLTPEQLGDVLLESVIEEVQAAVEDYLADLAKEAVKEKIREKIGLPSRD